MFKEISGSTVVILVLYVDDILLIGNDISMLTSVKVWLSKEFSMKDLGEASFILGFKCYDPGGVPKAQGTKAKAKVHHS